MGIRIKSPGPLGTIQDGGRYGYMDCGFSVSGAMDYKSMAIANFLVGNDAGEGVIEMTLMGVTAEFTTDTIFAVTGADMSPTLNGKSVPMYAAVQARKGDLLVCGYAATGCRAYLAFADGFYLKKVLGSLSTNLKCKIGGYLGKPLEANDLLFFKNVSPVLPDMDKRKLEIVIKSEVPQPIRAVLGPQDDYFTPKGIETFFSSEYKLTNESDRMGIKLEGPAVESKNGVDIISDGIPLGGVQIPSSGKPIVMMADRQTTGGYAKIATVISADIGKLAQLKPGESLRFEQITLKEAQKIYKQERKYLRKLEKLWKK